MDLILYLTSWCCILSNAQFFVYVIIYRRKYAISTENLWIITIQFLDFLRACAVIFFDELSSFDNIDFKEVLEGKSHCILGLFQEEVSTSFKLGIFQSIMVNRYGNWKKTKDENPFEISNELIYTICLLIGPGAQFIYLTNFFPIMFQRIAEYETNPFSLLNLSSYYLASDIRFGALTMSIGMLIFICVVFNCTGNDLKLKDDENSKNQLKALKFYKECYYKEKNNDEPEVVFSSRMTDTGFRNFFMAFLSLTFFFEITVPMCFCYETSFVAFKILLWIMRNCDSIRSIITSLIFRHNIKFYRIKEEED
uniref:7TM_GPCR_Srx domain-containing protein n=1 Tax=Parastrongyloides trichosuri TaxID=131310 RepID=A0A0N4Z523_PARTI